MATWRGPGTAGRDGGPPGRRFSWRFSWPGLLRGVALVLAPVLVVVAILPLSDDGTATAQATPCGKAAGPFTVHGTQVLARNGSVFISYGMSVSGLQDGHWTQLITGDLARIKATARTGAPTRSGFSSTRTCCWDRTQQQFNSEYLAAIESEVSLAESYHLVVVLNDETNFAPVPVRRGQAGPTPGTEVFWKDLTRIYGHDPQVIFDLFNEPRTSVPAMGQATLWRLWLDGGTFDGVHYPFGMAALAAYVRNTLGAQNLLWIEGPRYSLSFAGMIRYHALIHVSGVVYAIHHAQGAHDVQAWNSAFGYLVEDHIAPVVNGEFTNYEPPPDSEDPRHPRLLLEQRSHHGSAVSAVPELARHRHERLSARAALADRVRRAPGRTDVDQPGDLELRAGRPAAARPERGSPDPGLVRAAQRLTAAAVSRCGCSVLREPPGSHRLGAVLPDGQRREDREHAD